MNLKTALLLFLILFATTVTTLVVVFDAPNPEMVRVVRTGYNIFTDVNPMGDPIDGPWAPT